MLFWFLELLKSVGYLSGFIGKWHLGNKPGPEKGFDWCSTNQSGPLKHFDTTLFGIESFSNQGYREDIFFNEAMVFIEEAKDRPFFAIFPPTLHTHPLTHPKNSSNHFERLIKRYPFDLSGYDRKH